MNYIACDIIRVLCRYDTGLKLKLVHNNTTLSLDCVKSIYIYIYIYRYIYSIYRVSREECARLRENVP